MASFIAGIRLHEAYSYRSRSKLKSKFDENSNVNSRQELFLPYDVDCE